MLVASAFVLVVASPVMRSPAAVIFLHGSGDTGPGVQGYLRHVWSGRFPEKMAKASVDVLYPSATPIPYTLARGQVMSIWYDRYKLSPAGREHTESIEASCARLEAIVDELVASGLQPERIAIGGFSMGGGIALQMALRSKRRLGGVFALSSYMCTDAAVYERYELTAEATVSTRPPIFMRHGDADRFIAPAWGVATAERLKGLGFDVNAALLPGVAHEMVDGELEELAEWVLAALGVTRTAPDAMRAAESMDPALQGWSCDDCPQRSVVRTIRVRR